MRIAVCDDDNQLKLICAFVNEYLSEKAAPCEVLPYSSALAMTKSIEKGATFDICLLDICMPNMTGIELARVIRSASMKTEIVFLTTSDDYAVDAFAVKSAQKKARR